MTQISWKILVTKLNDDGMHQSSGAIMDKFNKLKQLKNLSYKVKWRKNSLLHFSKNAPKTGKIPVLGKPTHMPINNNIKNNSNILMLYLRGLIFEFLKYCQHDFIFPPLTCLLSDIKLTWYFSVNILCPKLLKYFNV